jgi:hypothetical protein
MQSTIVKVQISLSTTHNEPQVMIYDEPREIFEILPLSKCPGLEDAMADAGPLKRAYFRARIQNGKVQLDQRMPEQDW